MEYICTLCPRNCGAKRTDTQNNGGYCKLPLKLSVCRAMLHFWEEPPISGKNGSGAIFFAGCPLKCCFCQNVVISRGPVGREITPKRLSEIFRELEEQGAHNINLVSPTPYVPLILEAFRIYRPKIPVVYNTGGYETEETMELLRDFVDIFLFDFKFFSPERATRYAKAENYPSAVKKAILKAAEYIKTPQYDQDGMLKKGIIIRHLLLPSGTKDACRIIDWVRDNCKTVLFSLMNQYTVMPGVGFSELSRKVTPREYKKVLDYMIDSGLDGFVQEAESASQEYIPDFDGSGV